MTQRTDQHRSQAAQHARGDSRSSRQEKEDGQQARQREGEPRGYYGSGGSYGYGGAFEHGGHSRDLGARHTQKPDHAAEEFYEASGGFGHETPAEERHLLGRRDEPGREPGGELPDGDGDE